MTFRKLIVACLVMSVAASAWSQTSSLNDWLAVQRLIAGDKLRIELKSGKVVHGEFKAAADTSVTLSADTGARELARTDIKEVYRTFGSSIGKSTLIGASIGAAAGATLGVALGQDCRGNDFLCPSRGGMAAVGAAVLAIPGAIIGLIEGATSKHRQLIYEA